MWGCGDFRRAGILRRRRGPALTRVRRSASDVVEQQGKPRRTFLVLGYPVITFKEPDLHRVSLKNLLGDTPDPEAGR